MAEGKAKPFVPFIWGVVVGAIILLIVIFSTGWVMTSGSAQKKVKQAIIDQLAPICVEQALRDPDKAERLKELKAKSYWERDRYMEETGWATMPGSESPVHGVADECAERLIKIE